MDTPQKAQRYAERFDAALQARMREVGLTTYAAVADAAGITPQTLIALRKGQNYPSNASAWGIDGALRWQRDPSSTIAIFNGGEPVPLPDEPAAPPEDPWEARIRALPNLSAEKKEQIVAKMRADRQAEIERAEALDKLAQHEGPRKGRNSA